MVEEVRIPVPWGHVAGRWWGPKDKQPMIVIHGWQDNAGSWDNLMPLLPNTLSFLCIDLPGMGLSSHYPTGMMYFKIWDGVLLVRRIVQHYDWTNVNLMGHSLGSAICFAYALAYADEVDRIIFIDSAVPVEKSAPDIVRTIRLSVDQALKSENGNLVTFDSYDEMIDLALGAYNGSVTRENCKVLMKRGITAVNAGSKTKYYFNNDPKIKFSAYGILPYEEIVDYAKRFKFKVLNIMASPGLMYSKLIDHKFTAKLKESSHILYVEVKGTHHVHLEAPEAVVTIIEDFLEDLFY